MKDRDFKEILGFIVVFGLVFGLTKLGAPNWILGLVGLYLFIDIFWGVSKFLFRLQTKEEREKINKTPLGISLRFVFYLAIVLVLVALGVDPLFVVSLAACILLLELWGNRKLLTPSRKSKNKNKE